MNNTQDLIHGFVRDRTPQHYITFGHCESTKSDLFNEENGMSTPNWTKYISSFYEIAQV